MQDILGKEYVTFQPNKIIYAVSENNASYKQIINSDFGICFHTIYKGNAEIKEQSFKVDATRLKKVPTNIYIMSPAINRPEKISGELKRLINIFNTTSEKLLHSADDFNALTDNALFIKYWNMFENNYLSDNGVSTFDSSYKKKLIEFINKKLKTELEKKLSTLKTDKSKEKANETYLHEVNELTDIIDNSNILDNIVDCINIAAKIKLALLKEFKNIDIDTFFKSKTRGYIPTAGEGIAMSDNYGNVVKLVDRSTFSNANRDDDIERGFTEDLDISNKEKYAVIGWGRLNPPTRGHDKLVKTILMYADKFSCDALLYLSHKQNNDKDPLSYEQKLKYCKEAFPEIDVVDSPAKTIIEVMHELYEKNYTNIIYVCGSDRFDAMKDLLEKYNNKPDKAGNYLYAFKSIEVKSAGMRDADSDDFIETISASMARQFVKDNDFEDFKEIVPLNASSAKNMFNDIAKVYGRGMINESTQIKKNLKQFVNDKLRTIDSVTVIASSSRHPKEIARVKINPQYQEKDVEDDIKMLLMNIPDINYIDYDFHTEASNSFKAFKIESGEEDYYITVSTKQKKEFTPNKVLKNLMGVNIPYNSVEDKITYYDEEIQDILKTLCIEAMSAKGSSTLKSMVENVESGTAKMSFACNKTVAKLRQLEPELLNRIIGGIEVDFNEIYGAVGLASCISSIFGSTANIIYPARSNEPLLDYTIYIPNKPLIRVSAKTGKGASPSCSSIFDSINELLLTGYENKELNAGTAFSKFMHDDYLSKSVNSGYVFLRETMEDIINGKSNIWIKELPLSTVSYELSELAKLDLKNPDNSDLIKDICNSAFKKLGSVTSRGEKYPDKKQAIITRNLGKLLIDLINNSILIDQMNKLLTISFGSFVQVYSSKTLMTGNISYEIVSVNEENGYKFNYNIGMESDGTFRNNKLAIRVDK